MGSKANAADHTHPPDPGQTRAQCQADPALPVKGDHHMAVATLGHTSGDLAHWEVGVSRRLEAGKWGDHPERCTVKPTQLISASHCPGRPARRHEATRVGVETLTTRSHAVEDTATGAWNKQTYPISSGSTQAQGEQGRPAPQHHAQHYASGRGLWGMEISATGQHITMATQPPLGRPASPCGVQGVHGLLPPPNPWSTTGLWCVPGPEPTCNSHGSDPATWQGSNKPTGVRKTPEEAIQTGLVGKDQGRSNCGRERTFRPTGPLQAHLSFRITLEGRSAPVPASNHPVGTDRQRDLPSRHTRHQKCSAAWDQGQNPGHAASEDTRTQSTA